MKNGRVASVLAVTAFLASTLLAANPAGSQGDDSSPDPIGGPPADVAADPIGGPGPADPGMSAAQTAELESEAGAEIGDDVVMDGTPIVPQGTNASLDDGETRVDDNQAGLVSDAGDDDVIDTQPAEGATAVLEYNDAVEGTSSTITFTDAAPLEALLAEDVEVTPAVQEVIDTAKRSRVVTLSVPDLSSDLAAASVTVELFPDVSLDLSTNVAPSPGQMNSQVWSSVPAEDSTGNPFGVITMVDDRVYGGWWHEDTAYEIVPLGNGDHLLYEVGGVVDGDPEHWDMVSGHDNGPSGLTGAELGISEDGEGAGALTEDVLAAPNIDVMVAYDAEVATALGSHQAAVDLAILNVNLSNITYLNSGAEVPQNFTLTNVYATGYTPTTTSGDTYKAQLANKTDGTFDAIHSVRDANYADFVVLLFNRTMFGSTGGSLCGTALFPTSANPAENDAYNITKRSCATTTALTFPHELGHNQCAGHDVTGGGCTTYTVDNGYVDASTSQRTIMARNSNTCCTRRPVWSNPSITWNGWTPGTASTDNNFVLEQEDLAPGTVSGGVANYRVNPVGNVAVAGTDGVTCAFNTIEDAITLAPPGSTIYISPGIYPAQSAGTNYNISKDLDLVQGTALCEPAASPAATGVILRQNAGNTGDAILEISGSGTDVTLDRITVEGSTATEGNIQIFGGSTLTLDDAIVRNANTSTDGGGVRVLSGGTLISVDNTQIENNTSAGNGGGIWTSGGTVNLNGLGDVDNNTAVNGGGIYAAAGATVTMQNDADVLSNDATSFGGGIYADASTVVATGGGAYVGLSGSGNSANQGGGIYATNSADVTIENAAEVNGNTATFAGGVRTIASAVVHVTDADIDNNSATTGGGGMYCSSPCTIDLNPGADIVNNTSTGNGGGIVAFGTIDADGGTTSVDFVDIGNNTAGTTGGGVYLGGTASAFLDTVHISNNDADSGGGAYVLSGATLDLTEGWNCDAGETSFEQYCNEFRGNTAVSTGSAAHVAGGTFDVDTVGFIANTTANAVVYATGAADVDIRAAMFLSNTTSASADGIVTALDTANINIVGVTFADNDDLAVDSDSSTSVWNIARVITDNGAYGQTNVTGSCNIRFPGQPGGLPGQVSVDPRFETSADTAYMPGPFGFAGDRCAQLGGHASDSMDFPVKDADGVASATEWDIGGIEADRQPLLRPFAAIVPEGDAGTSTMSIPVNLDIPGTEPITIHWQTVDTGAPGIATENVDYIATSGTLTFLPGSLEEFVDITIIGDLTPEPDALYGEWIIVTFDSISENAEFDNKYFFGLGIGIIFNDDGPPP